MNDKSECKVLFLLFDYVEVLDFSGTFDVFSVADLYLSGDGLSYDQGNILKLYTVSELGGTINVLHGLKVEVDYSFENCPSDIDVLIIPGAAPQIIEQFTDNSEVVEWVKQHLPHIPIVASVCSGAFILARAGGFDDALQCTTNNNSIDDLEAILRHRGASAKVVSGVGYVDNPKMQNPRILSSGGVSAGIDQAFHILREILGNEDLASGTAAIMEYNEARNWRIYKSDSKGEQSMSVHEHW